MSSMHLIGKHLNLLMLWQSCTWLLLSVFFLVCQEMAAEEEIPSAQTLFANCLANRDEVMKHGYLRLRFVNEHDLGSPDERVGALEIRFWFADEQIRLDLHRRPRSGEGAEEVERFAVTETTYSWIPVKHYGGVVAPVSEFTHEPGGVMGHFRLFHPRWVGLGINTESLMQYEPRSRLLFPETKKMYTVEREEVDGGPLWRVRGDLKYPPAEPGGAFIPGEEVLWFDPSAGGSLVRAEMREFATLGTKFLSVRSRLRNYGPGDHWFPEEVVKETRYGSRMTQRSTITTLEADFNTVPSPATFTVAGMELAEGKHVGDRSQTTHEVSLVSDGKQLIPTTGPEIKISPPPTSSNLAWLLLLNAVLLAGIGIYLLLRDRLRQDYNKATE